MADYTVTCNGCASDVDGRLYTIPAYYDGESFNSYVFRESDVSGATGENVRDALYEQPVAFTDIWRSTDGTLFVSDSDGRVHVGSGEAWHAEPVSPSPLNTVRQLPSGQIYAGGDDGSIYARRESAWQPLGASLGAKVLGIAGLSPDDLYVCGEDALLAHHDGRAWRRIDLPTRAILSGVLCLAPGDVLVCAQDGTLFRGSADRWHQHPYPGRSFYRVMFWRNRILIAAGKDGLMELSGTRLVPVKDNIAVYRVGGVEAYLTVAGGNLGARFDGVGWFGARYA